MGSEMCIRDRSHLHNDNMELITTKGIWFETYNINRYEIHERNLWEDLRIAVYMITDEWTSQGPATRV